MKQSKKQQQQQRKQSAVYARSRVQRTRASSQIETAKKTLSDQMDRSFGKQNCSMAMEQAMYTRNHGIPKEGHVVTVPAHPGWSFYDSQSMQTGGSSAAGLFQTAKFNMEFATGANSGFLLFDPSVVKQGPVSTFNVIKTDSSFGGSTVSPTATAGVSVAAEFPTNVIAMPDDGFCNSYVTGCQVKVIANSEAVNNRKGKVAIYTSPSGFNINGQSLALLEENSRAQVFPATILDSEDELIWNYTPRSYWRRSNTAGMDTTWRLPGAFLIITSGMATSTSITLEVKTSWFICGPSIPQSYVPNINSEVISCLRNCILKETVRDGRSSYVSKHGGRVSQLKKAAETSAFFNQDNVAALMGYATPLVKTLASFIF